MIIAISNGFTRMASSGIFLSKVFMQFAEIFGHSCVRSKHLGHTIQTVSMRRILVQCCKYVKDFELPSFPFQRSFFASCQSKICFGQDGTLSLVSPNSDSCQAGVIALGLPEKTTVKTFVESCVWGKNKAFLIQMLLEGGGIVEAEFRQQ